MVQQAGETARPGELRLVQEEGQDLIMLTSKSRALCVYARVSEFPNYPWSVHKHTTEFGYDMASGDMVLSL